MILINYDSLRASKIVLQLAEENIKATSEWTSPEQVIDFIEKVYGFLMSPEPTKLNL